MTARLSDPQLAAHIDTLAPLCPPAYRAAFEQAMPVLARFAIHSFLRMAHFMAQVLHETAALTRSFEDLDYSAARLPLVWPMRFRPRGPLDPALYTHDPRTLANAVYGARLGNVDPNDGFRFRGRGLLQLTGKDSYARVTTSLCEQGMSPPDFTRDPDAWYLGTAGGRRLAWQGCPGAPRLNGFLFSVRQRTVASIVRAYDEAV